MRAEARHAGGDLVEVEDQVGGGGVLLDPAGLARGGRPTNDVERHGRGAKPFRSAAGLASKRLFASGVSVVTRLAKRAQVGPVEPQVRAVSDGDDVVDDRRCLNVAGVGAEATERVGVQEGATQAAPVRAIASASGGTTPMIGLSLADLTLCCGDL